MRPRLVEFFAEWLGTGFFVPDYVVMLALAVVLGVWLCVRQSEEAGLDAAKVFRAAVVAVVVAFVSARLYVVVQHWEHYASDPADAFTPWSGGLASYGALLGGTLALLLAARRERLPVAEFLDACAPSLALALALGRVGCFLNGCCHGSVSGAAWGVSFPPGSDAHVEHASAGLAGAGQSSLPVHPTQLYEAAFALALFFLLLALRRRVRRGGELFALFFLLYPLGRFANEFLRGDERGTLFGLSLPQVLSLAAVAAAACVLASMRRGAPGATATAAAVPTL